MHTHTHAHSCIMRKRCKEHNASRSCQTIGPAPKLLPSPSVPPLLVPHLFPKLGKGALARVISGSEYTHTLSLLLCACAWMCARCSTLINGMKTVLHSLNWQIAQRPTWACAAVSADSKVALSGSQDETLSSASCTELQEREAQKTKTGKFN